MWKYRAYTAIAGAALLVAGLFFSRALISIGVFIIFLHAFLNHNPAAIWQQLWANKPALLLILLFGLNVLSGVNTQAKGAWADDVLMKLPFLLLPAGLVSYHNYKKKYLHLLLWLLLVCSAITALAALLHYALFYDEFNARLAIGLPAELPTKISHIYFGCMAAFAAIAGFYMAFKLPLNLYKRIALGALLLIILLYLHLLGSRTGLAAFYGSALVGGFIYLNSTGNRWRAALFISAIAVVLVLAILFIPALHTKALLTWQDLQTFFSNGDINDWSLSKRLAAWAAAWQLFLNNPILGVGMGDIRAELWEMLPKLYPLLHPQHYVSPHNQFLTYLAGLGIVGGAFFVWFFFYPMAFASYRKNLLLLFFWLIILITFLVEEFIERQIGVAFFVFFWVYLSGFSNYSSSKKSSQTIPDETY